MLTHIVGWRFREDFPPEQRAAAKAKIKTELEALVGVVPGLRRAEVITELLPGSGADFALLSTLDDEAALETYQTHPAHLAAAGFVRSVTGGRCALDFLEPAAQPK